MDTEVVLFIILTLLLSAFFSGVEIAFISANRLKIAVNRGETRKGKILGTFFDKQSRFLATTLVGNNIALVLFGKLMTDALEPVMQEHLPMILRTEYPSLFILTIFTTIVVLIFGEFLPKTLFRLRPATIVSKLTYVLRFFWIILWPIVWVTVQLSKLILRIIMREKLDEEDFEITRADLKSFIMDVQPDNELFQNALDLMQVKVADCMVPRTELHAIDVNESVDALLQAFIDSKHSKLIVYDETIDKTVGYVHHQKMLKKPKTIKEVLMELPFAPEVMSARDLMNQFIKDRVSIAIVVDEFGGTAGIVTLEDILEEIFGEIEDEHDAEDYIERKINDKEFMFSGRLEVDYINEKYNLNIPEGEYQTLSGFIVTTTERIPEEGKEFKIEGYNFILETVSDTKIEKVKVQVLEKEES